MANPYEQAIRKAIKAGNDLADLFARLGTKEHPRGRVLVAYRNAVRALRGVMSERSRVTSAREIFRQLKFDLRSSVGEILSLAQILGVQDAAVQLELYGLTLLSGQPVNLPEQVDTALAAILAKVDAQEAITLAMLLSEAEPELILGSPDRAGVLKAGDVLLASSYWVPAIFHGGFSGLVEARAPGRFQKQAVAALDNKTTDCCLRVHGQIVDFDAKFHLTGTPRYADYVEWPPCHWWCRTSTVLYDKSFDFGLTERMRDSAQMVLDERRRGIFRERRPADAFA